MTHTHTHMIVVKKLKMKIPLLNLFIHNSESQATIDGAICE